MDTIKDKAITEQVSNRRSLLRNLGAASIGVLAVDALTNINSAEAATATQTVIAVDSIADLKSLTFATPPIAGQQFRLLGYYGQNVVVNGITVNGRGKGGGIVYYDGVATSITEGNDFTVFVNNANSGVLYRFKRPVDAELTVMMAGALGNLVSDDTAAIQKANDIVRTIDHGLLVFSAGSYSVSSITLDGFGTNYRFDSAIVYGNATTATDCVVEIKTYSSSIRGLAVNARTGSGNHHYTCSVHWYTNDKNVFPVGRNHFEDWYLTEAKIGLVIGALPAQGTGPLPTAATSVKGVAVDAPLSESSLSNMRFYCCVKGIYMNQSNGKVTFTGCNVSGDTSNNSQAVAADCVAIEMYCGEMDFSGGSIEQIFQPSGALVRCLNGNINIRGAVIESVAAIDIDGASSLRMSEILNWGLNNNYASFFRVSSTALATLDVANSFLIRPAGYQSGAPVVRTVSSFSNPSASVNTAFIANFSGVDFRDPDWRIGATYFPLVQGARFILNHCFMSLYSIVNNQQIRGEAYKLQDGSSLLPAVLDQAAKTIVSYPTVTATTSGGWSFSASTPSNAFGSVATGLPSFLSQSTSRAVRLTSIGGQECSALSPFMAVEAQRVYQLKGFAKTNGSGAQIVFRVCWFDFAGNAASIAQTEMNIGAANALAGTSWAPFAMWAQAPNDAVKCKIFIAATNSADLWFANLEFI